MLTQKEIKRARVDNTELVKHAEKYTVPKLLGRLNLAYLKALERTIDTIILNKNMFSYNEFCIQKKELMVFTQADTIAMQELMHKRITGIGYRTLIEEFELQNLDLVDKALLNYDKRSSLHTELLYADDSNALIGINIKLPENNKGVSK